MGEKVQDRMREILERKDVDAEDLVAAAQLLSAAVLQLNITVARLEQSNKLLEMQNQSTIQLLLSLLPHIPDIGEFAIAKDGAPMPSEEDR